jgi:predicted 2-oxoglutarate/Fe(II)-dependent dioxygenase YbiX
MNYFVKEGAIKNSMIDVLLNSATHFKKAEVITDTGISTMSNSRRCRVVQLSSAQYFDVFNCVHDLFSEAKSFFNEEFCSEQTTVSLMQYTEQDLGHFDWHTDVLSYSSNSDYIRRMSMSILLDDDYEGGQLCFEDKIFDKLRPGTCIIFPSTYRHKVNIVSRGIRHSLVSWAYGPRNT